MREGKPEKRFEKKTKRAGRQPSSLRREKKEKSD